MAKFKYKDLEGYYAGFTDPFATILINNKPFDDGKSNLIMSELHMELSCGFEASFCTFRVINSYDKVSRMFRSKEIKECMNLGAPVEISLGYGGKGRTIFMGFITKIDFVKPRYGEPGVEVTAMDVKSIMMANRYDYQLKAKDYGGAVKEIFEKPVYKTLQQKKCISKVTVTDTPDKSRNSGNKASALTMDMVAESDYEFVVRAAKKFNYEFFVECGEVLFRKAKADKNVVMELNAFTGLMDYDVSYDMTGLVSEVEARGLDVGKGELITASDKNSGKLSSGNMAAPLIKSTKMVVVDPTVSSKEDAKERVSYLLEDMSYRFGKLEARMVGLPELLPGYFVELKSMGDTISNKFYLTNVRHDMDSNTGFITTVTGKACEIKGGGI